MAFPVRLAQAWILGLSKNNERTAIVVRFSIGRLPGLDPALNRFNHEECENTRCHHGSHGVNLRVRTFGVIEMDPQRDPRRETFVETHPDALNSMDSSKPRGFFRLLVAELHEAQQTTLFAGSVFLTFGSTFFYALNGIDRRKSS
jgi:hypothetical protein